MNSSAFYQSTYFRLIFIFLLIVFTIVFHGFAFFGHFGYDDIYYAQLANNLMHGNFNPGNDHYAYRWGILYPVTFFYWLFGIHDFASSIPALLDSFGTLYLMLRILRTDTTLTFVLTVTVYFFYSWVFFYADKLMPDTLVAFAFTGIIFIFYEFYFGCLFNKPIRAAVFFNLFLFYAFILHIPL